MKTDKQLDQEKYGELLGIIPAAPGWYTVDLYMNTFADESLDEKVSRSPIIAWKIYTEYCVPLGLNMLNRQYFVLSPDGTVIEPGEGSWFNLADFVQEQESTRK